MPTGFYAYASESKHLSDTIEAAIASINDRSPTKIESWSSMKIGGKIVIREILNRIKESDLFLCDVTGLNPNVLFELGYAIGLRKRVWVTLDTTRPRNADLVKALDILSGIGYRSHTNHQNIADQFLSDFAYIDLSAHVLADHDSWIDGIKTSPAATDVFYIPSSVESTAVKRLMNFFSSVKQKNRRRIVVRDKLEDSYDPLRGYLRNMLEAHAVIAHLDDAESADAPINNARCSLLAGMALGFDRQVLMIAPAPFDPPFDYRDLLVVYRESGHCEESVKGWLTDIFMTRIEERSAPADSELTLLAFHIGETTAENEELALGKYFVHTASYAAGVRSRVGVFVGRKGTGKTANLYQLREHFAQEKRNIVITLKPVSFRIAAFARLIEEYFAQPDLASDFIERTWRAIVYAEIAAPLCSMIKEDTRYREPTKEEAAVTAHVARHRDFVEADFAGRIEIIRDLVTDVVNNDKKPKVALHAIAEAFTRPLVHAYSSLFRRYQQIVILVDNLDKAWSISAEDRSVQTQLISGILDFQNTIVRELSLSDGDVRILVFLREDIFTRVMEDAYEPDKVRLELNHITWPDPGKLVEVLERRFLACSPDLRAGEMWVELFCHKISDVDTKEYLLERVMPRPRDLIYVVRTAIDNCVGRSHSRIEADDLKDALREYHHFLLDNMFTEYGTYLATLRDLIQAFSGSKVRHNRLQIWRVMRHELGSYGFAQAVEFLFRFSFLGIERQGRVEFAYTNDDVDRLVPVVRRGLRWLDFGRTRFVVHPAFHAGLELQDVG